MTPTDERLRQAFLETSYGTALERFRLGVTPGGTPSWSAAGASWAVITAWNPGGRPAGAQENRENDGKLREALLAAGWPVLRATNGEEGWAEPAYVVLGLGLQDALALGRSFGQAAVLWASGRRVALAWGAPVRVERRWFVKVTPVDEELSGPMP